MAEDIVVLTSGLYSFMVRAEPVVASPKPVPEETADRLLPQAERLLERFTEARRRAGERTAETIDEVASSLHAMVTELGSTRPVPRELKEHWDALGCQYEALVLQIRQLKLRAPAGAELGQLKPRNYARNVFHMCMGVVGISVYEFMLDRTMTLVVGGSLLALFIMLEIARRLSPRWNDILYGKLFSRISRPREAHKPATSTWYMSGLFLGVLLMPKHAIELGCLVLAFGDPAAGLIGKRFGRLRIVGDKSVIGTVAFFVVSAVLCFGFLSWRLPAVPLGTALFGAAAVAAAGALAELFSTRINDNVSIPLVAGAVAALVI